MEQCIDGNVASQPKLHLQQTLLLLCPKPYKHPKTIKLNLNTTIEEDNDVLPHCPLFLFLLRHKEGEGSLLPSPSLFQQHHRRR